MSLLRDAASARRVPVDKKGAGMKSTSRFRIVTHRSFLSGLSDDYAVQEQFVSRNGKRKRWRYLTVRYSIEGSSVIKTWRRKENAEEEIKRILRNRRFIPRIVEHVEPETDPDYVEALKELEMEL